MLIQRGAINEVVYLFCRGAQARLAAACSAASSGPRRKKWNHIAAKTIGMTMKNTRHSTKEGAVVVVNISTRKPMTFATY